MLSRLIQVAAVAVSVVWASTSTPSQAAAQAKIPFPTEIVVSDFAFSDKTCPGIDRPQDVTPDGATVTSTGKETSKCGIGGTQWTTRRAFNCTSSDVPDGRLACTSFTADAQGTTTTIASVDGSSGKVIWQKSAFPSGLVHSPSVTEVLAAGAGGVCVSASSRGQLPGQPREASGKPAVMYFDARGNLKWTHQGDQYRLLAASPKGGCVSAGGSKVTLTKSDGRSAWTVEANIPRGHVLARAAVGPDGSVYVWEGRNVLFKVDRGGRVVWRKEYDIETEKVINAQEGAMQVTSVECASLLADKVNVYCVGPANTRFEYGSVQRDAYGGVGVMAFSPKNGAPRWVNQYRAAPLPSGRSESRRSMIRAVIASGALASGGLMFVTFSVDKPVAFAINSSGAVAPAPKGGARTKTSTPGSTTTSGSSGGDSGSSETGSSSQDADANLTKKQKAKKWFKDFGKDPNE